MGRVYELGARGIAAAAGANYATISSLVAGNVRARIREIGFFASAATLTSVGLGRPANEATPPVATTSVVGITVDPQDAIAAVARIDTAWSTVPTVPANFLRRIVVPAVAGAGFIWTWPADTPLILKPGGWYTLWNFGAGAGAAPDLYVRWEE